MVDCNYCRHINIAEWMQGDNRVPHLCMLYQKRIFHGNSIFALHPCLECIDDGYKNYSELGAPK